MANMVTQTLESYDRQNLQDITDPQKTRGKVYLHMKKAGNSQIGKYIPKKREKDIANNRVNNLSDFICSKLGGEESIKNDLGGFNLFKANDLMEQPFISFHVNGEGKTVNQGTYGNGYKHSDYVSNRKIENELVRVILDLGNTKYIDGVEYQKYNRYHVQFAKIDKETFGERMFKELKSVAIGDVLKEVKKGMKEMKIERDKKIKEIQKENRKKEKEKRVYNSSNRGKQGIKKREKQDITKYKFDEMYKKNGEKRKKEEKE